jgi:hypothetical protein
MRKFLATLGLFLLASCASKPLLREERLRVKYPNKPITVMVWEDARDGQMAAVEWAVDVWNSGSCQMLKIVDETYEGHIDVAIGMSWGESMSSSHVVATGSDSAYEINIDGTLDVFTAATLVAHELGHALGLADETNPDSIMYPHRTPMSYFDNKGATDPNFLNTEPKASGWALMRSDLNWANSQYCK